MGFPLEVKQRSLVASARHCCVCHKNKGLKIEVHHIVPEADGGTNDFDNAMPLCFDCHTDAGHYNPRHPRGIKFSSEELKKHRDNWYRIVEQNKIPTAEDNILHCRYFVTRNFNAFKEIAAGSLDNFPVDNCILLQNTIYSFQRSLISFHRLDHRNDGIDGDRFENKEEYLRAHPDAIITKEKNSEYYPYFEATRIPDYDEIKRSIYYIP